MFTIPSPLQEIETKAAKQAKVRLLVKRDDLIHATISGNKWRKLKYVVEYIKKQGIHTLVTSGGYYSNHLYAVAAAGRIFNFQTVGIIRGEEPGNWNHTLSFIRQQGMHLEFLSRKEFAHHATDEFLDKLKSHYGSFYFLPQGGADMKGVEGCTEILNEIKEPFDYLLTACGTGTTLSGLCKAATSNQRMVGVCVLKNEEEIRENVFHFTGKDCHLLTSYHFGGYAKVTEELKAFRHNWLQETGIDSDLVYTSKLFYAIHHSLKTGYFKPGSTLIALHTGGLQGNAGLII